ncbi:molybdopterin-dependent oxidoreductase [Salipaludibacillus sp. CUR1]|uniref:molybdopterin-dependent oxidoreductase n=1 Tax=Salipaludibacillus sp. CUR1 TaxID=2820003 RepID=UPI001E63E531|nr:molybdopterin-dependent oxidoreductase [Salipaludibacillus sp. CUR1]MCE7791800.1 molybdopterin-dependent oxidoreductase [Salipaludibacillus sp. CUR1]
MLNPHKKTTQKRHVCPRNCYSTCTMISHVKNGKLYQVTGDKENPYTNGTLCAKAYSYIKRNYHPKRLKYPYYQEVKGSGNFKRISWKTAIELIENRLIKIDQTYQSFLPVALYKYTGNLGVKHYASEEFFSSIGPTTRIVGSPCSSAGFDATVYDFGRSVSSDPDQLAKAKVIVIWGGNPAATSIHSIPLIQQAQVRGACLIVIDPIFTQTAEIADIYIQIKPGSDGALANFLTKTVIEKGFADQSFIDQYTIGFKRFSEKLDKLSRVDVLQETGMEDKALEVLTEKLMTSEPVFHWIGLGLQRHTNGGQMVRTINALAASTGMIGKEGAGVHYAHSDTWVFKNQQAFFNEHEDKSNRVLEMTKWIKDGPTSLEPPLEFMWVTCRNPLVQDPQPQQIRKHFNAIPFVVTVDQFMTPTARWSNLILPATTHFEEEDIAASYWHRGLALNEKAIEPYFESQSDLRIMQLIATKVDDRFSHPSDFPVHDSNEDYLRKQWTEAATNAFGIPRFDDAKGRLIFPAVSKIAWRNKKFDTPSGKYEFYSERAKNDGYNPLPINQATNAEENYPLQLLTPHDPYALNSQFHFLGLGKDGEAFIAIHEKTALDRGIEDGDMVKVFNDYGAFTLKAQVTYRVAHDVVMIYTGWYPNQGVNVNELVPVLETDMGDNCAGAKGIAFHDTFVEVERKF